MKTTQHLRIRGRVQGVGFRQSMCAAAGRLGCTGWVRNRSDGSVEAVLQGPAESVNALIAWARQGPPGARVDGIDIGPGEGCFDRFEVVRTA